MGRWKGYRPLYVRRGRPSKKEGPRRGSTAWKRVTGWWDRYILGIRCDRETYWRIYDAPRKVRKGGGGSDEK